MTTPALLELKVRARIARNAAVRERSESAPRLARCLQQAARRVGFEQWEQARCVLDGQAQPGDDMGSFWHAPRCSVLLNHWFADLTRAKAGHREAGGFLLPYRRQFVVVQEPYVRELGLDPADPLWAVIACDLVAGYGSEQWEQLCLARIKASADRFG